jgi:hypothetical protein
MRALARDSSFDMVGSLSKNVAKAVATPKRGISYCFSCRYPVSLYIQG